MAIKENDKPQFTAEQYFAVSAPADNDHTELIDGRIVMYGALDERHHDIAAEIFSELRSFVRKNNGNCKPFIAPFDVVLDDKNVVQPDLFVLCDRSKSDGKRINGAPDLVIEITSSNSMNDYKRKLTLYREHGVREYRIVDPDEERVIVYHFGTPVFVDFYDFDKPVPVGIWDGALEINIAELLGEG